jgi:hypothetical protein
MDYEKYTWQGVIGQSLATLVLCYKILYFEYELSY